eukprot:scaffold4697_cov277-Prasinococcus_capsulatus_cf.AAC.9
MSHREPQLPRKAQWHLGSSPQRTDMCCHTCSPAQQASSQMGARPAAPWRGPSVPADASAAPACAFACARLCATALVCLVGAAVAKGLAQIVAPTRASATAA